MSFHCCSSAWPLLSASQLDHLHYCALSVKFFPPYTQKICNINTLYATFIAITHTGDLMMHKPVPILITCDVDPTPEVTIENKKHALNLTKKLLQDLKITSTFFFHARIAAVLADQINSLITQTHEIGCHGLTHGNEEEYSTMPQEMQQRYLFEATYILQNLTNQPIRSFRGPRVKTSATTQQILEQLGYIADCSVASQRIDLVSSNLINTGWITAPRLPYHPNKISPFKKGNSHIWVVPLSALALPFISSALYVFGLTIMKSLFHILYLEALRTGKPVVYLLHPFEFAPYTQPVPHKNLSRLKSIRTHGLSIRSKFYQHDHKKRYIANKQLFSYIKSFPNITFMSVTDFVHKNLP